MRTCANCGEENPDRFRLCGFCGTALPPVAPPAHETRKTVTILFSDLKGSTTLGEALDSESLREVMSTYFDAMSRVIERHGGTVEKYIGDAVMAVFGLPLLHEDDALRAVRAAADMQSALREVNDRLEREWGVRLQNRTGVNTGEVVAGDATTGQRLVTGDAVNVAARLEQAAPASEVLLGELTLRLVADAVDVEAVEPLALKGKSEPVRAYRLLSVRPGGRPPPRTGAPMVGRARELAAMRDAFDAAVAERTPRLVTVLADAGMGKSRLTQEFLRSVAGEAEVLRGRCLPYGDGITFWPLGEAVREAAGIDDDDSGDEAVGKLAAVLGPEADPDVGRRVAAAVGLTAESFPLEETFWAARKFFEGIARHRPLVVLFDDLHWAQPTFLDLVDHIVATGGVPLVVLGPARRELLEEREDWASGARATRLELGPLSEAESAQVVGRLLGGASVPERVRRRVMDAADGNPLFAEQLVSMLVDEGLLERRGSEWVAVADLAEVDVPPTVQALLAARLDRLAREERAVIEPAAVVGHVFYRGAVVELVPDPLRDRVDAQLRELSRKGFVHPDEAPYAGEAAYRFHHVLIRDAAYRGLLKRARAALHERFADWLERTAGERILRYEEILGYHLEQAYRYRSDLGPLDDAGHELGRRAADRLAAAGRRAFARGDSSAAATLLRRAADLLPARATARLELLPDLGEALMDVGQLAHADALLTEAIEAAEAGGDTRLVADARVSRLLVRCSMGGGTSVREVIEGAEEAIAALEAAGDHAALARAWRVIAFARGTACQYALLEEAIERSIQHARAAGDRRQETRNVWAFVNSALYGPTPVPIAIARCEQLMDELAGDRRCEGLLAGALGHLNALRGCFEEARRLQARAKRVLEDLGDRQLAASTSFDAGRIEMLSGDAAAAERLLRRDYAELEAMGETYLLSTLAALIAEAAYAQGRLDEAAELCDVARTLAAEDDVASQALSRGVGARVIARRGDHDVAAALAEEAVALLDDTDELVAKGDLLLGLADVLATGGRREAAADAATRALALYREKQATALVEQAEALLESLTRATAPR